MYIQDCDSDHAVFKSAYYWLLIPLMKQAIRRNLIIRIQYFPLLIKQKARV